MDFVIGSYAEAKLAGMYGVELRAFEELLELPDPAIEAAVFGREALGESELAPLIAMIRTFHGLESRFD